MITAGMPKSISEYSKKFPYARNASQQRELPSELFEKPAGMTPWVREAENMPSR